MVDGSDLATEDRLACECDHDNHDTGQGHAAGARLPASSMKYYATHRGAFRLCPACAGGCYAAYIQPEVPA